VNCEVLKSANRNNFIEENKKFIYFTTYNVCKRHLSWENDDELSISLIAFNNACENYNEKKGDFFSYARAIIKNALIDHFRKNSSNTYLVFESDDEKLDYLDHKASMEQYDVITENKRRAEEIILFSKELKQYGLDFSTLVDSSPSHSDTRDSALNLALTCSNNDEVLQYIKSKKLLPIKLITLLTGVNKKFLEKWRRYLLALIIVLSSSEYPYIKSYLNIKVGDKND
jgi:RNA polymerase sigma factor